ncbi:MAG: ribosomal RNA small subunit methyltransferase A [Candidatus Omnitrophica bacterium]|nr:ribosomal RNA small subunit methyltransferase A [Candidatus Omnitrophota bacterium]
MNLRELKTLWEEQGFRPKKRLGQNFLIDKNVRDNILRAMSLEADSTVVEIGAGFGMMSFDMAERCGRLYAVEKDTRICGIMEPMVRRKQNLTLIEGDILDLDICILTGAQEKITVMGNIPYYITTPVIEKMVRQRSCIRSVYIVMQEEFADRLVSSPGSRVYGSISCYVQFYTAAKVLFKIKRTAFYPSPNVNSCLLRLDVLPEPSVSVNEEELMFRIIRKAFSQRRKKVINSLPHADFLSTGREEWREIFGKCAVDPSLRAEDLSLSDYARLSDAVGARTA